MYQADTCYFPYIPDDVGKKRRTYLIVILDDFSRLIVGARLFFEDNAFNFQRLLKDAVATYGIPLKCYVDHGPSFQNSQLRHICASIGTVLLHTPIRDGASKGKVERAFGVLKTRWLNGLDLDLVTSLEAFNQELTEAVRQHNLTVNSATKQTPMERFLSSRDHIKYPKSAEWLTECFMNRINRKVRNDATISVLNIQYDAPMQFAGHTVEIRYLPGDLDSSYIYDGGLHYPLKRTDKQANSKVKRQNWPTVDYSKGVI